MVLNAGKYFISKLNQSCGMCNRGNPATLDSLMQTLPAEMIKPFVWAKVASKWDVFAHVHFDNIKACKQGF